MLRAMALRLLGFRFIDGSAGFGLKVPGWFVRAGGVERLEDALKNGNGGKA